MSDLNNVSYSKNEIEKILNILNILPVQGLDNILKMADIINILNTPFIKAQQDKQRQNLDK